MLYNSAQAFVLPSTYEAVSLTVLEAQATGTPVITVDTPGLREATGGAAFLIAKADVGRIVAALQRVAGDVALRRELAERGVAHARQFSWQRCSAETLALLAEVARGPR